MEEDSDEDFRRLDVNQVLAQKQSVQKRKRRLEEDQRTSNAGRGQVWSLKYEPRLPTELAVHPKKVEEVRSWLLRRIRAGRGPMLILRGPSGAGKTATLRVLAREMNLELHEYALPTEIVAFENRTGVDALDDGSRYLRGDSVAFVGQAKTFEDFLRRACSYGSILTENGSSAGRLVVIEELPPFARRGKDEFKRTIGRFTRGRHPIVVVASDGGGGGRDRAGPVGEDAAVEMGADTIIFNAASTTNLLKCLKAIADKEAVVSSFRPPEKEALAALAETSKGDIRAAVNALQFACMKDVDDLNKCFETALSKASVGKKRSRGGARRIRKASSVDVTSSSSVAIGGRDGALDLFHSLGKVLYNKREDEEEPFQLDPRLTVHRRRPLLFNPEAVLDLSPLSAESFACFLHQSYVGFFSKMTDLARAADCLSLGELLFQEWTVREERTISSQNLSLPDFRQSAHVRLWWFIIYPRAVLLQHFCGQAGGYGEVSSTGLVRKGQNGQK